MRKLNIILLIAVAIAGALFGSITTIVLWAMTGVIA